MNIELDIYVRIYTPDVIVFMLKENPDIIENSRKLAISTKDLALCIK
jgi:hypothetical protein